MQPEQTQSKPRRNLLLKVSLFMTTVTSLVLLVILVVVLVTRTQNPPQQQDQGNDNDQSETQEPPRFELSETFTLDSLKGMSFSYDKSWTVEVKDFGEENTLNFESDYTPTCDMDSCAGIRLSKGTASLDMLFNRANDTFNMICRKDKVHSTDLGNRWVRFDSTYPKDSFDEIGPFDYIYSNTVRYFTDSLSAFSGVASDTNGYYFPDFDGGQPNGDTFFLCDWHEPLFYHQELPAPEGASSGPSFAIRAAKPRLFFDGEVDSKLLEEMDQIIETLVYGE